MTGQERREWNRYPCDLRALCQPAYVDRTDPRPGRICDISLGGVQLVSTQPFPLGTALTLSVDGADELAPRSLTAEVVRTAPQSDGRWAIGCRLARLMSERELARLLSLYQGEPKADVPLFVPAAAEPGCRGWR